MPDAVHKQCLDSVRQQIDALSFTEIASTDIIVRKSPWNDNFVHRGITISWEDPREASGDARPSNSRDVLGYPCVVTDVTGNADGSTDQMNAIATRRQKIFRSFNNHRLTSLVSSPGVNNIPCTVSYGSPTIPKQYADKYDASQMIVWCWMVEQRTN